MVLKEVKMRCVMIHRNTTSRCLLYLFLFHLLVMLMIICFVRWEVFGKDDKNKHHNAGKVKIDGVLYHFPVTLVPKSLKYDAPKKDGRVNYIKYLETIQVECRERARVGVMTEAGWELCLAPPFSPSKECIVYSFGIANDWTFDDSISSEFNCRVRAFDSYMSIDEHDHTDRVHFFPVSLDAEDRHETSEDHGLIVHSTLARLMKQIGDSDKIIDYLKIDIEGNEWTALPRLLEENSLRNVKQVGIELHTANTTTDMYTGYVKSLRKLESQGFKKWAVQSNIQCTYYSEYLNRYLSHCYKVYFINLNFLR